MKKAVLALMLFSLVCLGGEPVVVKWSQYEGGGSYFSIKPEKGMKLIRVEWAAFLAEFAMSWTHTEDGWKRVKTPSPEPPSKEQVTLDMHIPPIRHAGEELIIVTPTISSPAVKK